MTLVAAAHLAPQAKIVSAAGMKMAMGGTLLPTDDEWESACDANRDTDRWFNWRRSEGH